jgi:cytochrome c oxidase subunit IV
MDNQHEHPLVPYRLYVLVWLGLVALTGLTVGARYADLQHVAILAAILIATVKAVLVVLYFMHIRYERPVFGVMILVLLVTYGIYIGLVFTDYPFR